MNNEHVQFFGKTIFCNKEYYVPRSRINKELIQTVKKQTSNSYTLLEFKVLIDSHKTDG